MSTITNVSSKLGELMLKGWVLTDSPCPASSCRGVPLLRSPKGQMPVVYHCASCDGPPRAQDADAAQSQSSSTTSSMTHASRPSTPPTEFSSTLSSPTFAPPVETEEMIQRRQQSDQASTEIGKRLLKGWAMLGEECPNSRCYGIPLVRPPKSGSDKDPRKECVICGTVYITEGDDEGWQRLVPISSIASRSDRVITAGTGQAGISDNGGLIGRHSPPPFQLPTLDPLPLTPKLSADISHHATAESRNSQLVTTMPVSTATQDAPMRALELALGTLSEKLTMSCANPAIVDPSSIAMTADAISKVAQALAHVKHLQQYGSLIS
ncbi:hypothetical protein F5I97DRAFT_1863074 [Phlebopus sp. FC_14]|nr:hypothetical protein F5I97DRAFT_1863074 [Phlebopus sp. FC_14]